MEKIIASISTPHGTGAISIVRMSGEGSLNLALKFFSAKNLSLDTVKPRYMYLGDFNAENISEKCLMVYFKAPYSFTGEDMVEFQIHGGELLTQNILEVLLNNGAALAENGEFSKRAFVNGKMSLDEAEGIVDVIEATSTAQLKAGFELMKGKLFKSVEEMQNMLTQTIARIEVTLDYPEHDDEEAEKDLALLMLEKIKTDIEKLLKNSKHSHLIKGGVNVALVGKPNVGKSSLLNALLNQERAIVTDIKGTTRDIIKESINFEGVRFNFLDTAGLRESTDVVENIGISKTKDVIKSADIVVFLLDGSLPIDEEDLIIYKEIKQYNPLVVLNKMDAKINQKIPFENVFEISALKEEKIEELKQLLYDKTIKEKIDASQMVLTNQRHIEALNTAKALTENALKAIPGLSADIVNFELKNIWLELGKITGVSENEKIIDEIFSRFCLGK